MCRPLESRHRHIRPALKWNGCQFCTEIVKNGHVENIPRDSSTVGRNRATTVESRSLQPRLLTNGILVRRISMIPTNSKTFDSLESGEI